MQLLETIRGFLTSLDKSKIYNEFSLQHELGFFLRSLNTQHHVEFEKNISFFNIPTQLPKKEIDISIYTKNPIQPVVAIELKCPLQGRTPETMFDFCKDIAFLEGLLEGGFKKAYFIAITNDELFFEKKQKHSGIYSFFRSSVPLTGTISKPTGKTEKQIRINGQYDILWHDIGNSYKGIFLYINKDKILKGAQLTAALDPVNIKKNVATNLVAVSENNAAPKAQRGTITELIRAELENIKQIATKNNQQSILINAGHIHKSLNLRSNHRSVCDAMYKLKTDEDTIEQKPPSGYGANLTIRYVLHKSTQMNANNKLIAISTVEHVENEIYARIESTIQKKQQSLTLRSGDLHKDLNIKNNYPSVCKAMRNVFEKTGGVIIESPPKGNGGNLIIQFNFPNN